MKHLCVTGEGLLLVNNHDENIDVYLDDSPQVFRTLDIDGRQMNCSVTVGDRLLVGCRDRRIFVYDKRSLDLEKVFEVNESVHSMCAFKQDSLVAVGMSGGYVLILSCTHDVVKLVE